MVDQPEPQTEALDCFLDMGRPCGPSCMAYVLQPKVGGELTEQQAHCAVLVSAERLGRFLGGIVSLYRNEQHQVARTFIPPPGSPK